MTSSKPAVAPTEELLPVFSDYENPIVRSDGDVVIPLNPILKQNRAAFKGLADAFSEMMKQDVRPRMSKTWVE